MINRNEEINDRKEQQNEPLQTRASTNQVSDPQKEMKGPVSSTIKKTGEAFESNKSKRDADRERDDHM